ncbi:nucleoporin-domain-containing protein [Auricularia subglabra TFB-10046 SS5]|nr:nucleoporin-domain-containing protein [Auricularia subglabra TFB-10046 SS5]
MYASSSSRDFFNTPAGPSQSIWSINPAPAPLAPPALPLPPPKSAPVSLAALEKAARSIVDQLSADHQLVPDLSEMLQSVPQAPYSSSSDKTYVPFYRKRTVGVPDALWEYYQGAFDLSAHSIIGIMPEVERAWVTLNNQLFLWDYHDGQDISSFTEQPNIITNVSLVRPKPGVFVDDIQYLLVLCTPINVFLLGLACVPAAGARNARTDIKLYATDMSIATEGTPVSNAVGTKNGRIFMAGEDACLYELQYQSNESWFSKKIQLHNHSVGGYSSFLPFLNKPDSARILSIVVDDARHCLYTLTEKSEISLYYLGPQGDQFAHIRTIGDLRNAARSRSTNIAALNVPEFKIKQIHVIDTNTSRNVHLVAFTDTGVRLYFTHYAMNAMGGINNSSGTTARVSNTPPPTLQLYQVRPPPMDLTVPDAMQVSMLGRPAAAATPFLVTAMTNTAHSAGNTIGAQATANTGEGSDLILAICPDAAKMVNVQRHAVQAPAVYGSYGQSQPQRPLFEYATIVPVEGETWAIAEARRLPLSALPVETPTPNPMLELATQFSEPPKQFLVFTNAGITYIAKRRAVDHLKQLLEQYDTDPRPAQNFCQNYGRTEAAAMLLAIACGNSYLAHEGLEAGDINDFSLTTVGPDMAANAKLLFYSQGGVPALKVGVVPGSIAVDSQVVFSGRRDGLVLYFARLVRPLWRGQIVRQGAHGRLEANVFDSTLVTVQRNLESLRSFLERNPTLFSSTVELRDPALQEAWKIELASVAQLQGLLVQTIEAISFVLLLIDYQLSEIVSQCDKQTQQDLQTLTYEQLISTKKGRDVARNLVSAIINQQIGRQISVSGHPFARQVETISELLQQRCGSFCSADDVLLYKATENIRKAKETRDASERTQCLRTSYRFYSKGTANMEFPKLQEIVGEYKDLRFAKGAIELPLKCAREWDADNLGRSHWAQGCPVNDPHAEFYQKRVKCYDLVLDVLSAFSSMFEARANGVQSVEGEELALLRATAYQLAISSQDDVFHSYLYDWLLAKGMRDELVEIRTPFIEGYLRREPVALERAELLHIYYVKTGQYLRAAETCAALAESHDFDLDLEKRIQLFTFAVNYAKSHPSSELGRQEAAVEFLADLEEKLEVAQVQLEIYNELQPRFGEGPNRDGTAVHQLNRRVLNISELFQDYADPYGLLEIKLLILHVSDHHDAAMVSVIWEELFDGATLGTNNVEEQIRNLTGIITRMGQRFYPSDNAFPLEEITMRLERFALERAPNVPQGWVPRQLLEANVPYGDVFDIIHKLYESQVPPFHVQDAVQWLSGDMAILISDWVDAATRPQSSIPRREFPANLLDETIDLYVRELARDRDETRRVFERTKLAIRRYY